MTDVPHLAANITIDAHLPPGHEALFTSALTGLGIPATIRVLPRRRAVGDLQWLILAALPLQAFLSTLGAKAADDAYRQFQGAIRVLLHREPQQPPARPVVLQDTATGLQIILDQDLPAAAYDQLYNLDLHKFRLGPVHYDQIRKCWRSELDEAAKTADPPAANQTTQPPEPGT